MGFFSSPTMNSLEDLFFDQLQDMYDVERRLGETWPKLASAAHSVELRETLDEQARRSLTQIPRLERALVQMGRSPQQAACPTAQSLIAEADALLVATGEPAVIDAAIVAVAQRIEHYEIACYGTLRAFAHQLRFLETASQMQESLDEEKLVDRRLTEIALRSINPQALYS